MDPREQNAGRVREAGRFGLVGLMNTGLDFLLFSTFRVLAVPMLVANFFSTSICMAMSFVANRRFVFSVAEASSWKRHALLFFLGTAFGMYVLQSLALLFFERIFTAPSVEAVLAARRLGLASPTAQLLVRSNLAKAAATVVSTIWNYCFYRWVVFQP